MRGEQGTHAYANRVVGWEAESLAKVKYFCGDSTKNHLVLRFVQDDKCLGDLVRLNSHALAYFQET